MKKRVNVYPVVPILTIRTPIMTTALNCELSHGDILNCIYSRALVDEILPDGNTVRLNLNNYDKCNVSKVETVKLEVESVEEQYVEPVHHIEETVLPEETVIEETVVIPEVEPEVVSEEEIQIEEVVVNNDEEIINNEEITIEKQHNRKSKRR